MSIPHRNKNIHYSIHTSILWICMGWWMLRIFVVAFAQAGNLSFRKVTLVLSLFLISLNLLFPQGHQYFENPIIFNENSGLKTGYISDVIVDKQGFLWIGGSNGLQRFDGHYFKHYTHQEGDSLSLLNNDINDLYYDEARHQLWIATGKYGGGLSILDLTTETFKNYPYAPTHPNGINSPHLRWIHKDKFGTFWLSFKNNGLAKYIRETDSFKPYKYQPLLHEKDVDIALINEMYSYSPDALNDSLLWIGSFAGLLKFNVISEQFSLYDQKDRTTKFRIRSLYHHTNNTIYLETWAIEGLLSFNPEREAFTKCEFQGFSTVRGEAINNIRQISPKSADELWITTVADLLTYDVINNKILHFKKNDSQNNNTYGSYFLQDKNNRIILWRVGNHVNELHIYDPILQQIKPYPYSSDKKNSNFIVRRILEEEAGGKLWIAAHMSEGLYQLDQQTGDWTLFPAPKNYFEENSNFHCWDLLRIRSGELLVLTSELIYHFSEQEQQLIPWELSPKIKDPFFRRMIEDRQGNIWVGSYKGEGVFRINPQQKTIEQFKNELIPADQVSPESISDIQEDRNGNIWMRANRYSVYDYDLDTFYVFPYFYADQLVEYRIDDVGLDDGGNVWLTTNAGIIGITGADHPEKGIIEYFDKNDGLKMENPYRLATDHRQNMWLLSGGLQKLNPKRKSIQYFQPTYLQKGDLSTIYQLSGERMAVGYRKGIGVFYPDSMVINKAVVQPYVHTFKVFDTELKLDAPLLQNRQVNLKPNENFFSLEISALDPSFFGNLEFMYQLAGVDADWVSPKDRNYIAYTNIESGNYTFKLKAKNSEGIWNENPYQLHIHIATPWYKTWWAYLFFLTTISSALYWFYHFQLSKGLALEESKRLKELDLVKSRLYTNITHEFRTPLTVMLGMVDILEPKITNLKVRGIAKPIEMIRRNGNNLLRLINELLDLAKLDNGQLKLELIQADVVPFVKYLGESFHSLAAAKQISLTVYSETDKLVIDIDSQKLAGIISNLLSNAIKFTQAGGKIIVHLKQDDQHLLIKIKDNGIGIPAEELTHIFDRFYQVDNSATRQEEGTGVGLALTKELVNLMKGTIEVNSSLGKGSEFTIRIPISRNAAIGEIAQLSLNPTVSVATSNNIAIALKEDSDIPLVLIIEDNADVVYYLQACLKDKYRTLQAVDGIEGIEVALAQLPDVIICDVMMPGKDGFEVCKTLKTDERTDHIPIILLTAKATEQDRLHGLILGADAYLTKPFKKAELFTRLEQLVLLRQKMLTKLEKNPFYEFLQQRTQNPETKFLQKVIKIVLNDIENPDLKSAWLAQKLHLSESQIYRKLKTITGKSTAIFIRTIRLQKARELIQTTNKTKSEIAYQVGFKDYVWFSQAFKEEFGYAPSGTIKGKRE